MKLNKPKNSNYAASVVKISTLVPLENCDNVQAAIIMGNQVIVSNDVKLGDVGLYFPLETQLSDIYLKMNNLYRKSDKNINPEKKGYFEETGRIKCVKFRGNKSEGLFMPISSISWLDFNANDFDIGEEFDELNGEEICRKYVIKVRQTQGSGNKKGKGKLARESKLIDNQFRFHDNTSMLYKNLNRITPEIWVHISYKMHGTSGISSYVLCKKKLKWYEKIIWLLGGKVNDTEYDYLYSSRKVIKNPDLNPNAQHYYGADIWGLAHKLLEPFLQKGMTFYYEIVGFLPNGGTIQKGYDYGCADNTFAIYLYRITSTNPDGKVIEFSARQVQEFCKKNGLNAVPELYYGKAKDFFDKIVVKKRNIKLSDNVDLTKWREEFLQEVKDRFNEKECYICNSDVPEEGCVIRIEGLEFEAYKQKSNRFYELETKLLDKGESNIEEEN